MHLPAIFCKDNITILKALPDGYVDLIYLDPPFKKNRIFNSPLNKGVRAEIQDFLDDFNQFNANHQSAISNRSLRWEKEAKQPSFDDTWHSKLETMEAMVGIATMPKDSHLYLYLSSLQGLVKKQLFRPDYLSYLTYMGVRLIELHRVLKSTGSIYLHCDPDMSHHLRVLMDVIFGANNFRNEIVWCYSNIGRAPKHHYPCKHDVILFYNKGASSYFEQQSVMHHMSGKPYAAPDWWIDIPSFNGFMKPKNDSHVGYPTQKPLALLTRIIETSSQKGDIVLDPFCGCSTTCVAADQLGRKYIGIDISETAYLLTMYRIFKQRFSWSKLAPLKKDGIQSYIHATPTFSTEPPIFDQQQQAPKSNFVYLLTSDRLAKDDTFKIGITDDLDRRLNEHDKIPDEKLYYVLKGRYTNYREIEREVLTNFKRISSRREWVIAKKEALIAFIESIGVE